MKIADVSLLLEQELGLSSAFIGLIGVIIGAILGFGGAYLLQRQRFKREDKKKLFETVYGTIYPLLEKAKMRDDNDDFKQWPGEYWLTAKELVEIDGLLSTYSYFIPENILKLLKEAKDKGPSIEGIGEVESDVIFPFDLQKMHETIENEIKKRSRN